MVKIVDAHAGLGTTDMTWLALAPGPDQSMTLLPDHWGPRRGCPACRAAWSHVVALGIGTAEFTGRMDVLSTGELVLVGGPAAAAATAAIIVCVDGHYVMVESDGTMRVSALQNAADAAVAYGQIAAFCGIRYGAAS